MGHSRQRVPSVEPKTVETFQAAPIPARRHPCEVPDPRAEDLRGLGSRLRVRMLGVPGGRRDRAGCRSGSVTLGLAARPRQNRRMRLYLAEGPGFEPRLRQSECPVLPLNYPSTCRRVLRFLAEREGFEPPVLCKKHFAFRVQRDQPLCHLSKPRPQRFRANPRRNGRQATTLPPRFLMASGMPVPPPHPLGRRRPLPASP